MNITSIRDAAKRLHAMGAIPKQEADKFALAPVFYFDLGVGKWTPDEIKWTQENIMGGESGCVPVNMPYQTFIIFCPKTKGVDTEDSMYFVTTCTRTQIAEGKTHHIILSIVEVQYDTDVKQEFVVRCNYTGNIKAGAIMSGWIDGRAEGLKSSDWKQIEVSINIRAVVIRLCYEVMSKTSAIVRVEPKPRSDKGTQWHIARTHYCILTKKRAMQIRDGGKGISNHDVRRAAHWRRAHFRTLVSPRYKAKRNQRVPVCESWVGPEEWKGNDGKIYRVIQ